MAKEFLARDESGRGYTALLDQYSFDQEDRNYCDGWQTFGDWLDHCEVGSQYRNEDDHITYTRLR